jgi:hypothetical protein
MMKPKQQETRSGNGHVPPALAGQAPYAARLSARSALYTDLQLLLDQRPEPLSRTQYQKLIVEDNCLARSSVSSRRKIWAELSKRYLLDRESPLFRAFWREWQASRSDSERGLTAYSLLALNDRLVSDLGLNWLYSHLRRAPVELRVDEVRDFLRRAAQTEHPEVRAWTEDTQLHVAQHYMASIRDFGLARGKLRKTSVRPGLHGAPIRLLIRALRLAGNKDLEIVTAPIFRLLALEGHEVIDALGELNRRGDLRFRMQADVVELDIEEGG